MKSTPTYREIARRVQTRKSTKRFPYYFASDQLKPTPCTRVRPMYQTRLTCQSFFVSGELKQQEVFI